LDFFEGTKYKIINLDILTLYSKMEKDLKILGKSEIFFFLQVFYEEMLYLSNTELSYTYKDIESSSGSLEDGQSFSFVELSYTFSA
jgi:hypothetical protein